MFFLARNYEYGRQGGQDDDDGDYYGRSGGFSYGGGGAQGGDDDEYVFTGGYEGSFTGYGKTTFLTFCLVPSC